MRDGVEARVDRGACVETATHYERAIGSDVDALDRARPLRHEPFERRALWQLRRRGQFGHTTQHERGRRVGVAMRQAPDRGGHSRDEDGIRHEDS